MTTYSIKNVKKREQRSLQMRQILRQEKNRLTALTKKLDKKNTNLKREMIQIKSRNKTLEKLVTYQKRKLSKLTQMKATKSLRPSGKGKSAEKASFSEVDKDEEDRVLVMDTKWENGDFTDDTRFCVMELAGLDVATGKVGPVMETVSSLCGVAFSTLPSRMACQMIVDEGQVMAKTFIREKVLKRSSSFGIHKDGTTRKKVKILDTSICTDRGESFCLGWSSVVSETGVAIAEETKEKLAEIARTSQESESEILEIVKKINYLMNDRAANEKKSSRLIEEWRQDILKYQGEDVKKVHHLYCAAHVLLGFHSYVITSIKKFDFFPAQVFKHPIVILLRDAADLFGPVGDYRGLRNQWEAFLLGKGLKSFIKAYKDNRFNGLLEISSQVFYHREDFVTLLQSQKSRNAKQSRLLQSLLNEDLMMLASCLGLFFHAVTGPFWKMVTSPNSTHQNFKIIIQKLQEALKKCSVNPDFFLTPDSFSFMEFTPSSKETKERLPTSIRSIKMRQVMSAICDGLLNTIEAQLKEVLSDDSSIDIQAPLTNLISERNFGHLDASQRRRPHSSLHHHSSILLLKQTRKQLKEWYDEKTKEEKDELWRRVRKESKELRKKHQQRDMKTVLDSLKLKTCDEVEVEVHDDQDLRDGQMIAVACDDHWYPALVERISGQDIIVNFAALGKGLGSFNWPTGKDVHTVSRKSIVMTELQYEPRAGGRYWFVTNAKEVQQKYKKFK